MKKLLGIVVLGLLLSGCVSEMKRMQKQGSIYSHKASVQLIKSGFNLGFIEYGNSSREAEEKALATCKNEINLKKIKKARCETVWVVETGIYQNIEKEKKKKIANLENLKSTCREFGYNEGTESFADCVKDLYLQNTQAGKTQRKIDPSVWDDLDKISKDVLGGKSASEAISGSSSPKKLMLCFKTGEETGGLNKICRYDCAGNLVTTTIGVAQMCPIQIQR